MGIYESVFQVGICVSVLQVGIEIAAIHNGLVADFADATLGAGAAFGSLFAGTDLVVVDGVVLAVVARREVGHHHVGAELNAQFASLRMQRAQGRRSGQQHRRMQQADDGQQAQRGADLAIGLVLEGRARGGDERPDADHLGLERTYELQVGIERVDGLIGRADHKATTHLIANLFKGM